MRSGIHFHGKLKSLDKENPFNEIVIEVYVDRKTIDLLRKMDLIGYDSELPNAKAPAEIEVTIAHD